MLNIHRVITSTKAEGPGIRTCIYFQGCSHHCDECFAKDTWSFDDRILMSQEEVMKVIMEDTSSEGVTLLGGEPLDQYNEVLELCKRIHRAGKTIILFTGYTLNEIKCDGKFVDILKYIDVLIDGPFQKDCRDFSRPMVGSQNQNFIFLSDRYSMDDFGSNKVEIRISPSGIITINGQGKSLSLMKSKEIM